MVYKCLQKTFLVDAFELDTFKSLNNDAKRTLPPFRSLFSYLGAEATSFLVKTFYCDTEDVIHDIAN